MANAETTAITESRRGWVQVHPRVRGTRQLRRRREYHLATDYDAWMEYIDSDGIMKEDEFNSLTVAEKIEFIRDICVKYPRIPSIYNLRHYAGPWQT